MRIAQVAPLYERVPPLRYGGTERVVANLADELSRRGHAVTLFATGDSITQARLVASAPRALRLNPDDQDPLAAHVVQLGQVFERARDFDVIHCHVGHLAFPAARLTGTPTVHTLHGRLDVPGFMSVFRQFRSLPFVSISNAQRAPLQPLGLDWMATVYHGIRLEQYRYSADADGYLAFLGRISPEKRPDLAIEVAKRADLPLRIAAKVDPVDQAYFEREIVPLLDDPRIEFLGEIGETDKPAFLGGARALLFPIDWPEPFGLVMIEALACGVPVVARPCGSVPEVLVPGRTGFVADTVDDLVEAVKRLDTISRAACRQYAEERFTVGHMVDAYEAVYERVMTQPRAA